MDNNELHLILKSIRVGLVNMLYCLEIYFNIFLSSVLIPIHGFNQASQLNLITQRTFFNANPWFSAYFKFFILIAHSFLSFKVHTAFSSIPIFILSGKMVNLRRLHVILSSIEHQIQQNILYGLYFGYILYGIFIAVFYEIFSKLRFIFEPT